VRLEIPTLSDVPPAQLEEAPPYAATASLVIRGRLVAARGHGRTAGDAVDAVVRRLQRQARALSDGTSVERLQVRVGAPLPTDARPKLRANAAIVRRRPYAELALTTLEAVADLISIDAHFFFFRHARSAEDVCLDRFMNGRIGLIFPPGSVLADETDLIVSRPSRYTQPLLLAAALEELVLARHRFIYFVDAADEHAKVLYLRRDGNVGLVEPP
jgi:Sigma 54 modulation/S30EA ribosomal protein C terminus